MGDIFKEQIVKRKQTGKDTLKRAGIIIGVLVIFIVALNFVPGFAPIIGTAGVVGAFFLSSFLKVEYEYVFTNGELDIDIIYNRSRRKRVFSCNMRSAEIMAHVEDTMHTGAFHGAQETRDYSSGVNGPDTYAFLITHGGKNTKVIIEPNEKMMAAFRSSISRSKLHIRV